MKILEEGKRLKAIFECRICGCKFEEALKKCYIDYYVMSYRARCDCPCCGKTCDCYESDFSEITDGIYYVANRSGNIQEVVDNGT